MTDTQAKNHYTVKWITVTALFMALNVVMSSFGLPVPGGHLYLNDVIICTAAILLDPVGAFAVGGIGAFLGDFFFYPTPMVTSLIVHGLPAIVISLCTHKLFKDKNDGKGKPVLASTIGVTIGAVIMVVGYTIGRCFYASVEYAILKIPFQILQAAVGAVAGVIIVYKCGLGKLFDKLMNK